MLSKESLKKIEYELTKYPADRRQAAVMAALRIAQTEKGWLSKEVITFIADYLGMPDIAALEVASFYSMYQTEPVGKYKITVCTNISCMLRGAYDVLAAFEQRLGVKKGGTAGKFTIIEEECIAACANAPAVICGTKYFLDVTPDQVGRIVDELRAEPHPEGEIV